MGLHESDADLFPRRAASSQLRPPTLALGRSQVLTLFGHIRNHTSNITTLGTHTQPLDVRSSWQITDSITMKCLSLVSDDVLCSKIYFVYPDVI